MNIQEKIERFVDARWANSRIANSIPDREIANSAAMRAEINYATIAILEELQKMQQHIKSSTEFCQDKAKTCKWTSPQWINPDMSSCHAVAGCNCKSVIYYTDKPYCGYCGGKIEIAEVKK